jgi:hypothetical protein
LFFRLQTRSDLLLQRLRCETSPQVWICWPATRALRRRLAILLPEVKVRVGAALRLLTAVRNADAFSHSRLASLSNSFKLSAKLGWIMTLWSTS